ncbi:hypothetical protein [Streptomyces sp. NPDC101455]|uniref:hypothetical protein n=1 Tax=Streptomyces sp. NPDC101455 TaxID=3366142 RepID=UPI00382760AD
MVVEHLLVFVDQLLALRTFVDRLLGDAAVVGRDVGPGEVLADSGFLRVGELGVQDPDVRVARSAAFRVASRRCPGRITIPLPSTLSTSSVVLADGAGVRAA